MKYCTHCGAEIMDDAVLCTKCGCWTNNSPAPIGQQKTKLNNCALVGFILSLVGVITFFVDFMGLLALAGTILSIIGLVQIVKSGEQRGKGLAVAGIPVGACMFLFDILYWIVILLP